MSKNQTLNLNLLERLISELKLNLKEFDSKDQSRSMEDKVIDLSKMMGLTASISLESTMLAGDITKAIQGISSGQPKDATEYLNQLRLKMQGTDKN